MRIYFTSPKRKTYRLRKIIGRLMNEIICPTVVNAITVPHTYGIQYFSAFRRKVFIIRDYVNIKDYDIYLDIADIKREMGLDKYEFVMLYVASLGQRGVTALKMLLRAIEMSPNKDRLCLVVVGRITREVLPLIDYVNLRKLNVIFTDYIPRGVKYFALFKIADVGVFVLPCTDYAKFVSGMKLAEYIAAGLPVIAPTFPGPSDLIKDNGLTYNPCIESDLKDKLDKFVELSRNDIERMRAASLRLAKDLLSKTATINDLKRLFRYLSLTD